MQRRTRLILAILLPLQYLALLILRQFPNFVETYYSQGLYPYISSLQRYIFGWVPFSVGDIFYLLLILMALRWLYKNFKRLWEEPARFFIDIAATLSIIYFTFNMLWGFNYLRPPLHQTLGLQNDYTTEQLLLTTKRLIKKSNELHRSLGYKDSVKIELPYSQKEIFEKSVNGYQNLEKEFPSLHYAPKSIKKSGWSLGLTYMGYSGYYNPLTGEAQVNNLIQNYKFPVVSCHEEAHQIGYAAENEANFIATLASIHNEDAYIQYAGYIFVLRYCINELARRDMALYEEILPTVNFGILESYREMREFWQSYQNPFEDFSKAFWDQFLKANNQSQGIKSYSYMVALVVNYFEDKPL
ncbi:MAG: amino acid permease [Alteromonas sp.]|nr:amino acid permease [Alteromonas sp.]MAY23203.1 amino acid permease [Flavobacteriaceae bacterium]|tara:strand:- start:90119 stop:91186 length:1068 start_codon:yes stop_codon:yes gene_type:complete